MNPAEELGWTQLITITTAHQGGKLKNVLVTKVLVSISTVDIEGRFLAAVALLVHKYAKTNINCPSNVNLYAFFSLSFVVKQYQSVFMKLFFRH